MTDDVRLLVGTGDGLLELGAQEEKALGGHAVGPVCQQSGHAWALVDRDAVWRASAEAGWEPIARLEHGQARCLLPTADGVLVGTSEAHLLRLEGARLEAIESFERVDGRDAWHTPWGGPPDTRSLCAGRGTEVYANVHVGGVVRSGDGGETWRATGLDIKTDVHQVTTTPDGTVLVAAARGFGESRDAGHAWRFLNDGLHASYARAIAVADGKVYISVSRGPRGGEAAVYRRSLEGDGPFARCENGLPDEFSDNIDTHCLAARGRAVAFGTRDGSVWLSRDAGETWAAAASGLPAVACVVLA